jgi:hypothetical protein
MTGGFVASWVHLTIFDQIFLWYGQWPEKKNPLPAAIAQAGSPQLPIKAPAPAAAPSQKKVWTPVIRRILNRFPPPQ